MGLCRHTVDPEWGDKFSLNDSPIRCIQIDARTPKAQKMHQCDECFRIIHKGEEYRRDIMKLGAKLFHHKYCEDCLSVREVFFSSGWYFGELWEQFTDFVGDADGRLPEAQLLMLTKPARDKICDMIEEYWEHEDQGMD